MKLAVMICVWENVIFSAAHTENSVKNGYLQCVVCHRCTPGLVLGLVLICCLITFWNIELPSSE